MILAMDVGNTNIVLGIMKNDKLITSFRLTTQMPRTSDEFGVTITGMLQQKGIQVNEIKDVIIASVVPDIMYSLTNSIKRYFNLKPMIVGPGLKTGIAIRTDNPREMGADRIANCVAAYEKIGGPCIAIDFGTATTYDVVNEKGELIAAITSPGIRICADAMWHRAAQLPPIEIKKTKSILDAKNTITSMQTGLVYGYIGQVEYIVKQIKKELNDPEIKVIATGGYARIIQDGTDAIDYYDGLLTLKGLNIIYKKNR
ncbi:type III pantothenate kinase [Niameybacter massiliensis]|uniref:type III pantothenate kinase n=1 Tax=Niameybacter massiliensis TaxID=1658108 RepID=UPI0006B508FB|nr:type III pantothenate kinase [Niameybacter massiliensis]